MPKNFKPGMGAGDLGFTDLFGGRRVPKTHRRVKLNALIDELSALLGLVKTGVKDKGTKEEISAAQAALVRASGLIAGMKGALKEETEALAHLARAKARICELLAWELKAKAPAVYLNRLSDYLFLLALKSARK